MKKNRMGMALLFPLMAVLVIVGFAGGLGVIFMLLNETALEEWGVVGLGVALVVGVPTLAALAERMVERR
jgi:hypothetical protein